MKMCYIKSKNAYIETEEVEIASIGDMLFAGYTDEDLGIVPTNEENDEWLDPDSEKVMTYNEITMLEQSDYRAIWYWDGSDNICDVFEYNDLIEVGGCEIDEIECEGPAFDRLVEITVKEKKIKAYMHNTSPGLSPYYYVMK